MKQTTINIIAFLLLLGCSDTKSNQSNIILPSPKEYIDVINSILEQDTSLISVQLISNKLAKCTIDFPKDRSQKKTIPTYPPPFGIRLESLFYYGITDSQQYKLNDSAFLASQNMDSTKYFFNPIIHKKYEFLNTKAISTDSLKNLIYNEFSLPIFSKRKPQHSCNLKLSDHSDVEQAHIRCTS